MVWGWWCEDDGDSGGDGDGGDGGGDGGIDVRLVVKQVTFQADKDCVDDHREEWRQQLVETVKLVGNEHYIDHLERWDVLCGICTSYQVFFCVTFVCPQTGAGIISEWVSDLHQGLKGWTNDGVGLSKSTSAESKSKLLGKAFASGFTKLISLWKERKQNNVRGLLSFYARWVEN